MPMSIKQPSFRLNSVVQIRADAANCHAGKKGILIDAHFVPKSKNETFVILGIELNSGQVVIADLDQVIGVAL